jgi:hypothetical protein
LPSRLCTSTLSVAGCLKSAFERIFSARAVSPEPVSESASTFSPTTPPIIIAITAANTAPNVAVFQWAALQRPARPARFVFVMAFPSLRSPFREAA